MRIPTYNIDDEDSLSICVGHLEEIGAGATRDGVFDDATVPTSVG